MVFSTYVEMFLNSASLSISVERFLHICGDVSMKNSDYTLKNEFSPRMWRCFSYIHYE